MSNHNRIKFASQTKKSSTDQIEDHFVSATELKSPEPCSPPSAFEQLLFGDAIRPNSAFAFSSRLKTNSSRSAASESVLTEDFDSAASNIDDLSSENDSIYGKDILSFSQHRAIIEDTTLDDSYEQQLSIEDQEDYLKETMAKKNKRSIIKTAPAVTEISAPEPTPTPVEEPFSEEETPATTRAVPAETATPPPSEKFDVVEHVYETAKSVWSTAKGVVIFAPFMGVAEGVATRAIGLVGIEGLASADDIIKENLTNFDKNVIDPAVIKLLSVIAPIVGKGDDIVKSVVGMIVRKPVESESSVEEAAVVETTKISDEAENPETSTPIAPVH